MVRSIIRLLLRLFYRRVDLTGAQRVPSGGPLVVAANHHNSVVDAMLIVALLPRQVRVLAKAPLFRHPLIGPFLRLMGGVPVNRRLEAGDDPAKNEAMFAAAVEALRDGGALLIFPEGTTQPQPMLRPIRTGAARIVLGAECANDPVRGVVLLPVGMVFHDPGTFRSASVQVTAGEPVPTADAIAAHRDDPAGAVHALTARLADAIRARIVEAEDQYTIDLLDTAGAAWSEESGAPDTPPHHAPGDDTEAALAWKQEVMRAARYLSERQPDHLAALRRRIELYRAHLDAVGVTSAQLGRPYTARRVLSYVALNLLWLALGLPLALWGLACHALPYWATGRVVPMLDATAEEEATDKMAVGLVLYPLCWIAEGWAIRRLSSVAALVAFVVLLAPSGLLALAWRERLGHVTRQARTFVSFLADRTMHRRLLDERRALVDELRRLAEIVPSEPPRGEGAHAG